MQSTAKDTPDSVAGKIIAEVEKWLLSPVRPFATHDSEGFISISEVVTMCSEVLELTGGLLAPVAEAVRAAGSSCSVALNASGRGVRILGLQVRVRNAAEEFMRYHFLTSPTISIIDLLRSQPVDALLGSMPEVEDQLQTLRDVLEGSILLEVKGARVQKRACAEQSEEPAEWLQLPRITSTSQPEPLWWPSDEAVWHQHQFYAEQMPSPMIPGTGQPCGPSSRSVSPEDDWDVGASGDCAAGFAGLIGGSYQNYTGHVSGVPRGTVVQPAPDRRQWIYADLERALRRRPKCIADHMDPDGSVHIGHVFAARPHLAGKHKDSWVSIIRFIQSMDNGSQKLTGDVETLKLRLRGLDERIRNACEDLQSKRGPGKPISLDELMTMPELLPLMQEAVLQASGLTGPVDLNIYRPLIAETIRDALADSEILQVQLFHFDTMNDGSDQDVIDIQVSLCTYGSILKRTLDEALNDTKARTLMDKEGEVSLSLLAEMHSVRKMFQRAGIVGSKAGLEALRGAVGASDRYVLDGPRMSIRSLFVPSSPNEPAHPHMVSAGKRYLMPMEKDAKSLRDLLKFYFQAFNLQHNRVLMAVVEGQRRQKTTRGTYDRGCAGLGLGFLRSSGLRPVFLLKDLLSLPRIGRLFDMYEPDSAQWLLAAALQTDEEMPVRLIPTREVKKPVGAWAGRDAKIELTYIPNIRFTESIGRGEIPSILVPEVNPYVCTQVGPTHSLCVVSYSVSSDLTYGQSPKNADVREAIALGKLDPVVNTWDWRERGFKRQLLAYNPDIICVQGVQSIGFAERCSEHDRGWFNCDDEPSSNHLVHLYRVLSKLNYGVSFCPTLLLPSSNVVCFGNAVFWKRSRWQVEQRWSAGNRAAAFAELSSKLDGPRIIVCSSKSHAGYIQDWASRADLDGMKEIDLAEAMISVQAELNEAVARSGARPVWCGDFGIEPKVLIPELASADKRGAGGIGWMSACASVLGNIEQPLTSVARNTAGRAVDLVLHDSSLVATVVLGGLSQGLSDDRHSQDDAGRLVALLRAGYPSDHLMQLAVFVDTTRHRTDETAKAWDETFVSSRQQGTGKDSSTADHKASRPNIRTPATKGVSLLDFMPSLGDSQDQHAGTGGSCRRPGRHGRRFTKSEVAGSGDAAAGQACYDT